jgi:hypothetical protein
MNAERLSACGRAAVFLFTMLAAARAQAQTTPPSPAPTPAPAAPAAATEAESLKVTPYGIVFFNGFRNSGATNNADVPLWATGGPGSVSASARQSRLGLRVTGVTAAGGKLSGVVETDFFGGFPAIGIGENMGVVRLRLANANIEWEQTTLLVGQEWMVFAPGNPVSLAAAGIPHEAASGNPWARLPQVRLERRFGAGAVQGAVLAPSTGDFNSAFFYQPAAGAVGAAVPAGTGLARIEEVARHGKACFRGRLGSLWEGEDPRHRGRRRSRAGVGRGCRRLVVFPREPRGLGG